MRLAFILASLFTATAIANAQEKSLIGDFTKSPTEHIINQVERPFLVRSVQGVIMLKGGSQPLLDVLFEIQGPSTNRNIRRVRTDQRGRFKIAHVDPGTYKFKATLNGFQSVMGTVVLSGKAKKADEIKLEMPVGV